MWKTFTLNIHSVVHHKDPLCTVFDYARNFGNVAKEGVKRTTHWAANYFTNPKSWYPVPERTMVLSDMPVMQPLRLFRWHHNACKAWGTGRKRLVLQYVNDLLDMQETTMAWAGTLLSYLYQREVQPGESVSLEHSISREQQGSHVNETEDEDGILE